MATEKDDLPNLKLAFEALDKRYSRAELIEAHAHSIVVQLAKAAPDDRQRLCERFLGDLSKWPAFANEISPIFHEKLNW
jgi:hypothetical protein